jgi:hypothetical protein
VAKQVPGKNGGTINQFEKGDTNNGGRPPRLVSTIIRELKEAGYERVGPSSVLHAFELLMGLSEDKLKEYVGDKAQPMSIRIVSKAMLSARGWEVLQAMLDRAHGKAKQQLEASGAFEITVTKRTIGA